MGRDDEDDPGNAARLCRAHQGTAGTVNVYTVVFPSAVDPDLELFSQVRFCVRNNSTGSDLFDENHCIIFAKFSSKLSNLSLIIKTVRYGT
jgi:hypothetical protein